MQINQATTRGIINWQKFSIGQGGTVQINNGAGATLNRVTGGNVSTIAGSLSATGSVYVVNQAGVVVAPGGKVATGGDFVASTRDIPNSSFISGGPITATGTSSGTIVNQGSIASANGNVTLIGKSVSNSGQIAAPNGAASLIAGDDILLQPADSGLQIQINSGSGDVNNNGTIAAAQAQLSAVGGNVYSLATNNGGIIRATGTANKAGHVYLTAGGDVSVAGEVAAQNADGSGGAINVSGANATVTGTLDASATSATGAGGAISVKSSGATIVSGTLKARAGANGGNGGAIETSGSTLSIGGATVDAGTAGQWLLDPYDLTVDSSAATTINSSLGSGTGVMLQTTASSTSGPGTANPSGNGDIFINSALNWSTSATLTLSAYRNIDVNANITASGGGALSLTTGTGTSGDYIIANGSSISFTGGSSSGATLSINGMAYTLLYSMAGVQGINSGLSGHYALANSLDASGTSSWIPIGTDGAGNINNAGNGFSGILDGLGNTIANLTVNLPTVSDVGLFGASSGTIRDIGITGGGASGLLSVGALVGLNTGVITNAYAASAVSGSRGVGGLVGANTGTISNAFATGAVTVSTGEAGGLVGENFHATITNAYATGTIIAGTSTIQIGGLVGFNEAGGTISSSYATGAVSAGSGSSNVGGLVGANAGTITNSYWDTQTSGQSGSFGGTGETTAQLSAALPSGFSSSVWGNVNNQTTPYLLSNPGPVYIGNDSSHLFTLITTMAQLQAINASSTTLQGNYALANSLNAATDPTTPASWIPIGTDGAGNVGNSGNGFSGIFDGLGNTVANLTINLPATNYVGLFGYSSGTVRNVGIVGGAVSGNALAGGLVGYNIGGTITNAYATAAVSGNGNDVGGLVGANTGTISNAYATGAVSSSGSVGGLVGSNDPQGTISNAYATGAVSGSGSNSDIGGLVGLNQFQTKISNAYATGAVSGRGNAGGLVGDNSFGTISNAYWDTQTSGRSGSSGGTGETTAQLSAALPSGFSSSVWGNLKNQTTPYLLFHPGSVYFGSDSTHLFTLISTMAQLQAINASSTTLQGNYALANSLNAATDPTTPPSWIPIGTDGASNVSNSGNGFSGIFDGLGNTISNLTISLPSGNFVGLFGASSGTIRNIGVVGGSVSGNYYAGGLVGYNIGGTITNAYAMGAVSGGGNDIGGLVGVNYSGAISNAYATGKVSGSGAIGGLVGANDAGGAITGAYATGAVSGNSVVGGLAGINGGTISNAYATGTVSGNSEVGGLAGNDFGGTISNAYATGAVSGIGGLGGLVASSAGTISNSYWDTETSGQSVSAGGTGLTTAQLSAALPSGFSSSVWGNVNNQTTPYLLSNPGPVYIGSGSSRLFTLIFTVGQLQAINASSTTLQGNFALANSLNAATDPTTPASWIPIGTNGAGTVGNAGNGFTGIFDGLGNTIANLTINLMSANDVGLFGVSSGTIRNIGMVGGSVSGSASVGGLAGYNYGTISNAFATGSVTGTSGSTGGLVGTFTAGTITQSYATGAVKGSSGVGGLVGYQYSGGAIMQSYATGSVTGTSTLLGGLVGGLSGNGIGGTITQSYATGAVSGGTSSFGGLLGYNSGGTVTNSYWDTQTSGQSSSLGGAGLTTAQLSAALPSGFSSSVWGNVNNQTTPYLLFHPGPVYVGSDSSHFFTLIFTMGQLQAINASSTTLQGSYALASSLNAATDPTAPASWIPIGTNGAGTVGNSGSGFGGIFDGLGNSISNLTINLPSANYVGLFGASSGTIRNIGVVGGAVSGSQFVGGLAGYNTGTISKAYNTGTVSGGSNSYSVGGLVGANIGGTISNAYATGAVSGAPGSLDIGGLVGVDSGTISNSYATGGVSGDSEIGGLVGVNTGTITNAYAMGAASGNSYAGGLVGLNDGAISNVYATGAVSGGNTVGGLVGLNEGTITNAYATGAVISSFAGGLVGVNDHTISNGYWDTQTSGQSGSAGGTGQTTALLQGALPSGFSSSAWGTGPGLYPYPLSQYPSGTPQAISGIAYQDFGVTPLASNAAGAHSVSALVNGVLLGSATTGANGYYYILAAPGTFSGTQQVLAYLSGDATKANTYLDSPSGNVTNADLYGGYLRMLSGASTVSGMFSGLATALGSHAGSDFLYASGPVPGTSLDIEASNTGGFGIDSAINTGSGALVVNATGALTQSAALIVGGASSFTTTAPGVPIILTNGANVLNGAVSLNAVGSVGTVIPINNPPNVGPICLCNSGLATLVNNTATTLATSNVGGNLTVSVTTGALSVAGRIVAGGTLTLSSTNGNITLNSGATLAANSPGNALVIEAGATTLQPAATGGDFVNNAGVGALSTPNGGWLVYTGDQLGHGTIDGGLTYTAQYNTDTTYTPSPSVNFMFFRANSPIIDVTAGLTGTVSKTYDGTLLATLGQGNYTLTGVAPADLGSVVLTVNGTPITSATTGAFSVKDVGNNLLVTVSGLGLNELANDPYVLTSTTILANIGTINPALLTITANPQNKIYGTNDPGLTYMTGAFQAGDSAAAVLTGGLARAGYGTLAGEQFGSYAIGQGSLAANSNYSVSFTGNNLTIGSATLNVTANPQIKTYGTNDPALSYGATGLVNATVDGVAINDTASSVLTGGLARASYGMLTGEQFGSYAIGQGTLAANSNYSVSFTGNDLTIGAATLTITANPQSKTYGTNDPVPSYGATGLVNATVDGVAINDTSSSVLTGGLARAGYGTLAGEQVGSYAIGQGSLAANANYTASFTGNTLSITTAALAIAADNKSMTYGTSVPPLTFTATGFVNATVDGVAINDTGGTALTMQPILATTATSSSLIASYAITVGGATAHNYAITFAPGTLTIDPTQNLAGANLQGNNLKGANLAGVDLTGANLSGANLQGVNLTGAILTGANLAGANLQGVNLTSANLAGADLAGANLSRDDLFDANLYGSDLISANLSNAILTGANLTGADLQGANLHGTVQ